MKLEQIDISFYPPEIQLRTQHKDGVHQELLKVPEVSSIEQVSNFMKEQSSVLKHYDIQTKEIATKIFQRNKFPPQPSYLKTQRIHMNQIPSIAADSELSTLLSCGFDATMQVFELQQDNLLQKHSYDHPEKVFSCGIFNNNYFSACFDGKIRMFQSESVTEFFVEKDREFPTTLFANQNFVAFGNCQGSSYVFDLNRAEAPLFKLQKHQAEVSQILQLKEQQQTFVSAGFDGAVFLHDTRHLEQSARLSAGSRSVLSKHDKPVTGLIQKDNFFISASESAIQLNDVRMPSKNLFKWEHQHGIVNDIQLGYQEVAVTFDNGIQLLDMSFVQKDFVECRNCQTMRYLPRGYYLNFVVGTNNGVELYSNNALISSIQKCGQVTGLLTNRSGSRVIYSTSNGDLVMLKDANCD